MLRQSRDRAQGVERNETGDRGAATRHESVTTRAMGVVESFGGRRLDKRVALTCWGSKRQGGHRARAKRRGRKAQAGSTCLAAKGTRCCCRGSDGCFLVDAVEPD
jgi:hypothetical protein